MSTITAPFEPAPAARRVKQLPLLDRGITAAACRQALIMLRPDIQWKNPVMFVVEVGAVLTLITILHTVFGRAISQVPLPYFIALDCWLFLTVYFANFATAIAEARGKAQTDSLRRRRRETVAQRLTMSGDIETVLSSALRPGDRVMVEANQVIPGDGDVIEGEASVDESAITGESAPVVREAGGDRCGVTGGTTVLSDRIVVRITHGHGESYLDKMIALVEGAMRQRSPNEIALTLLLSAFSLIFLIVVVPLCAAARHAEIYMMHYLGTSTPLPSLGTDVPTLIALLVCLIPTTIGALLAAIGIAGMDRAMQANIIAKSGKAVEEAGDIDIVMLDKTGTITEGNRRATALLPLACITEMELARLAAMASAADETPEGRSIVALHEQMTGTGMAVPANSTFHRFTAHTRMSGVDLADGRKLRKGATDAMVRYVESQQGGIPTTLQPLVDGVASRGATPLVVADGNQVAGVIVLEDVVKSHMRERFQRLRGMGLRLVMITGDNPLTARAVAEQAGVDDFVAQATPEAKITYIRQQQAAGHLVAMSGDGTNDAPALAQADVALAMNAGTQEAKEAANLVDLSSDPSKLIEVVEIGKQLLMTRGALTTFSIANDVAKYFAIVPAMFAGTLPWLKSVDIMHLHSPTSAILSAVIFNALIIPALIPVALRGVAYSPSGADALLRKNLLVWGLGGVIIPFLGIKLIDVIMLALHFTG